MSTIRSLPAVSTAEFLTKVAPVPVQATDTFGRVLDGPKLLTSEGVRAGQKLNLEFAAYFPPLPDSEGYGSAKLQVAWEVGGKKGTSAPVQANGWWGYGTRTSIDVPADASGELKLKFWELRANGAVVEHPRVVTADVLPAEASIIKFEEDWENAVNGKLVPGGAFKIAYDVDRMKSRLNLAPGEKAQITAFVSFDGEYPEARTVLTTDASGEHIDMPAIRIPADAKSLRIWFAAHVQGERRPRAYDSDFGRDFCVSLV